MRTPLGVVVVSAVVAVAVGLVLVVVEVAGNLIDLLAVCGLPVLLDAAHVKTCTAVVVAGAGVRVGWWHSLHMAYGRTNK